MAIAQQKLDRFIAELEQRLDDAKKLKEIADRRPELIDAMIENNHVVARRRKPGSRPTVWDRIVAYFDSQKNAEATVDQISKALGITPAMIREQFYRRHKTEIDGRKDGKTAYWKIKR